MFQPVSPFEKIKIFFSRKETLPMLILVNVAVWVIVMLVKNLAFLFSSPEIAALGTYKVEVSGWLMNNFAVPANITTLISRPWTLFTYMFLHEDFMHILFNMLWLWWFGVIFVQYLSQRQLLGTYIFGGLAGAFFYIAAYNFFPVFNIVRESSVAIGASASILAIVVAIAFYVPNYTINLLFLGPVKIKYIALFTIVLDTLMLSSGNPGGHLAHLGGAMWGFAYVKMLPGFDPTRLFNPIYRKGSFFSFLKKKPRFKVYKGDKPLTDDEYNRRKIQKQQKIDQILEKISKSGYDSLSKEEKALLFSSSSNIKP